MANDNKTNNPNEDGVDPTRRRFLKNTGIALGGVAGGSLLGGLLVSQSESGDKSGSKKDESSATPTEARMFFTRYEDFVVLQAATERIYPEDDNGPGAIKLGVPYFIDKQLAGDYGSNRKEYMKAPLQDARDTNTYQTLMNRGDVFITGLRKMNSESEKRHEGKFKDLEAEQQDAILKDLEDEKIKLDGVASSTFFNLLRKMTIEGAYSDPLYGGNKDMQGWKMREYPGARASYTDLIDSEEFEKIDPVSLTDYQQK